MIQFVFLGSRFASRNCFFRNCEMCVLMCEATFNKDSMAIKSKKCFFLTFAPAPFSIAATVQTVVALLWLAPEGL